MELLRTQRLILREWQEQDVQALINMTSTEHIAYWLPEWASCYEWALPWIQGRVKKGYEISNPMKHFMTWAIVLQESDKLIGMINVGSDEFSKNEVGTGYFIDMDYENHGYMTEALKALCNYIFNTYNYDHIATMIQPNNVASITVAQKVGFIYVKDIISESGGFDEPITQKLYRMVNPQSICIQG